MTGDPLVEVAADLRAIAEMHGRLLDEAVHRARDRQLPGGDALAFMSPVASPEAWQNLVDHDLARWRDGTLADEPTVEDEDTETPLQTLVWWTERIRWETGRVADLRPTVATETAFLGRALRWAWANEPRFDRLTADIAKARARLEAVLRDGDRDDPAGVACFDCNGPLVRKMTDRGMDDCWTCKGCWRKYSDPEYRLALRAAIETAAQEDTSQPPQDAADGPTDPQRLPVPLGTPNPADGHTAAGATAAQIGDHLGVTASRVRQVVAQHGIDPTGQRWKAKLYDPDEVLRHTDTHRGST